MANQRISIQCVCGAEMYLAKRFGEAFYTNEARDYHQTLDEFFQQHAWCANSMDHFEISYEHRRDRDFRSSDMTKSMDPRLIVKLHGDLDAAIERVSNMRGSVQVLNAFREIDDYEKGYRRRELTGAIAVLILPGDDNQQQMDLASIRDSINRLLGEDGDLAMAREDERQGRR